MNSEKTVESAVKSILNQSYQNFEYIIIDGASTDKTLDIIEKYRNIIAKIISEPDNGIYDAMNKGIANSSGDYIFFLNSDDIFLHENILSIVSEKAQKITPELLYGDQVFLNKDTGSLTIRKHNKLNKLYLMKNTPCQPATFYRRDVFYKYGLFDTNFKIVSDQEWFLRVFLKYKISAEYMGFPVTIFNSGGISTSISRTQKLNEEREKMFEVYFPEKEKKLLEFTAKYLRCLTTAPVIKNFLNPVLKFEI